MHKTNNSVFGSKTFETGYTAESGSEKSPVDTGVLNSDIPKGLAMAFCQNAAAMTAFANMSAEEKGEILDMARHISSKKDMIALAQNISIHNLPN